MRDHTTFAVGGPADVLVLPRSVKELSLAIRAARALHIPLTVLGGGSNVLVLDGGIRGVVIQLNDMKRVLSCHDDRIHAASGYMLADVCRFARDNSLTGAEFACGIPGSIGGACFMNAGAYGGSMSDVLASVRVVMPDGSLATIPAGELALGYRTSRIRTDDLVVVSATFDLEPLDPARIRATMDDLTHRREEKQPLELPSAGSTFKRPEGHFAGKLIMDAGLQGWRSGGAEVSTKHAGFVVNVDNATAADVHAVIEHVQEEVLRQFGVRLEPEVLFLG